MKKLGLFELSIAVGAIVGTLLCMMAVATNRVLLRLDQLEAILLEVMK